MKALDDSTSNLQSYNVATDLATCVAMIFKQYSFLCGFSVQSDTALTSDRAMAELHRELYLADVELSRPPGFRPTQEFCNEIAAMLLELIDEQPEVLDLLPGRTFARTSH